MTAHPLSSPTVLVVFHDPRGLRDAVLALEASGFTVRVAACLTTAIHAVFQWGPFDALVCDHELPDGSGLAFLHWLREEVIATPFLLVSDRQPPATLPSRRFAFLPKPFTAFDLAGAVDRLLPSPRVEAARDASRRDGVAA